MMKAFFLGLLALAVFVGIFFSAMHRTCPSSGYERFSLVDGGKVLEVGEAGLRGSGFAPVQDLRSKDARFKYESYEHFLECGHAREKFPSSVNVVRFSVHESFEFAPSSEDKRTSLAPLNWREMPINQYSPADARVPQYLIESDPRFRRQAWFDFEEAGHPMHGRKHLVDSLGIEWLKDEPLDQAHLLGVWQGGWLFRSAKPGYYVWID